MDLLMEYGVSLTLTQWIEKRWRTVVIQLGNWSSAAYQLTMGLPQVSPLSPVLYNVYTKGLADPAEPKWAQQDSYTGKWRAHIQNIRGLPGGSRRKQCNNNWIAYLSGVIIPDLSSVQTNHVHCGVLLTKEQRANRPKPPVTDISCGCVWTNKSSEIPWDPLWQNADPQTTCRNVTALECKKGLPVLLYQTQRGALCH